MDVSQLNITEIITNTINTLFSNLFSSIDNSIYPILDDITFIDTDIINNSKLESLFGNSTTSGILLISNSLLIGFVLYYAIRLSLAYYTSTQVQRPYQFIFKILLAGIFMNFSFFLCETIISLNGNLSSAIRSLGESLFHKDICFSSVVTQLNSVISIESDSFNLFSLDGIIKSLSSVGLFNLIFSYSLRYIMIKVFVLLSPFAILSLSTDSTSWLFKTWLRSFTSLLLLQVFISIILLVIFSLDFESNLFSKFLYIGSIYALTKANTYIKELIGGISTDVQSNFSSIGKLFKK